MNRVFHPFLLLLIVLTTAHAQEYTSSSIFAHNDYVHPIPFFSSYYQQVGYIEADIFLQNNALLVAHTRPEIDPEKTLDELFLKPILKKILFNNGNVYPDKETTLTLMIDLKTEGVSTLNALVKKLKNYPQLTSCPTLQITVSGSMPDPALWKNFPDFIHFDGRPGIEYTIEQLKRISLISTDFKNHSLWNGKGILTGADHKKIVQLIEEVHAKQKKIRFWGAPDFTNAWMVFMDMKIDIIGTDDVTGLSSFIRNKSKNSYTLEEPYSVYQPAYSYADGAAIPKNIILMIGDGMGLTQLYSGYTANRGNLNIFKMTDIGFSVTTSSDSYITDSAAGGTAMATGTKTNNRHVGMDSIGRVLPSITERLKQVGYRTAIISNGDVTDATPASFYSHQPERSLNEEIAADFISSSTDILIGGGTYAFKNRKDKKNLFVTLEEKGYSVAAKFNTIDTIKSSRYVVLDDASVVSKKQGRTDFMTRSLRKTLATCTQDAKPFFIMAEGGQIDSGGHNNDMEYVVRELLDFDQAVGEVMKFIDRNKETLLIVTADHETGGLSLLGGDISQGRVFGDFSTNDHTAVMVPVFAYGPGAGVFRGVYQNTAINIRILELLNKK